MKPPADLPLLRAAMRLEADRGLCFHLSAAFVLDVPGAVLCIGTLTPPDEPTGNPDDSTVPFIHAWAEYRGGVYAPTTIEKFGGNLVGQNRAGYYALNGVHDVRTLTRAQLLRLDRRFNLKRSLRRGGQLRGGASFGGTLLDAAGVPWKQGSNGGTLPPHVVEEPTA